MATYHFSFPPSAAGDAVTVRNAAGEVMATGTAGPADGVQGAVAFSAALPAGDYVATAADPARQCSATSPGVFDCCGEVLRLVTLSYGYAPAIDVDDAGVATLGASGAPGEYTIQWGDGTQTVTSAFTANPEHTYAEPGDYTVVTTGPNGFYASIEITVEDGEASGTFNGTF